MEILYQGNAQMEYVNVSEGASFVSQQLLAVVWDEENNQQNWYVGLYLDKNDDGLVRVDHLQRTSEGDDCNWKRSQLNTKNVNPVLIVHCAVHGEWNI